jgi:hypothetical protein
MSLADELERALEIEDCEIVSRSVFGPTNHDALAKVVARLAALTERKAPGEVEGLVERLPIERMLCDLLAIIHRDGGHRQDEVGLEQAWMEAMMQVPFLLDAPAELATLKQQLAEREEALRVYADTLCEFGLGNTGCGKYADDVCFGCRARALTRNTDGAATCNQGSAPENGDG